MIRSVRAGIPACQAGCPHPGSQLGALPQASGSFGHVLTGQETFVVVLLILALVAAVSLTATWSGDSDRRKAALAVLDRFIRWRW